MKKLIVFFIIVFAFYTTNAQDVKSLKALQNVNSTEEKSAEDVKEVKNEKVFQAIKEPVKNKKFSGTVDLDLFSEINHKTIGVRSFEIYANKGIRGGR